MLIDDICSVRRDDQESSVLFELICHRYERRSLLITANQPFTAWDEIFPSSSMTVAAMPTAVQASCARSRGRIEEYQKMGIMAFIFSGYPHLIEAAHFGTKVLPQIKTCSLPHAYGRVPNELPPTPLGAGVRR